MAKILFEQSGLAGLKIVTPFIAEDNRGYFMKAYEKEIFKEIGIETEIVETFESYSKKNVVRGMHYQEGKYAQDKLVRVLQGEVYDVCVDIRPDSDTYGQWFGIYLNEQNHKALYIEKGFAHGFVVTSESALMSYTCSGEHNSSAENGIKYDDNDLNILWPIDNKMDVIQSERDAHLESFADYSKRIGK